MHLTSFSVFCLKQQSVTDLSHRTDTRLTLLIWGTCLGTKNKLKIPFHSYQEHAADHFCVFIFKMLVTYWLYSIQGVFETIKKMFYWQNSLTTSESSRNIQSMTFFKF